MHYNAEPALHKVAQRNTANLASIFKRIGHTSIIAETVASMINVHAVKEVEGISIVQMGALIYSLSQKDEYTGGHSLRVGRYATLIAGGLGLSEREVRVVGCAGLLHDIGKLAVPRSILINANELSKEEFAIIKNHPRMGHNMLIHMTDSATILNGVLQHHERLNGSGYYGVKGDDIHLCAKIIAVADTFDAIVTDRPYQKGVPPAEALKIMNGLCDRMLIDPHILTALASLPLCS